VLATDILDDAHKKEHSFSLALNLNQRCWKNRVLVVSQAITLSFSFLFFPPLNGQAQRERERDGHMIDSWMDRQEVKLTMARGCSNLTLFATILSS
jgi:hypothetical protein